MATATKICKVCGKEYPYCRSVAKSSKFHYQDVACSPECGAIYFQRINESRGIKPEKPIIKKSEASKKAPSVANDSVKKTPAQAKVKQTVEAKPSKAVKSNKAKTDVK